MNKISTVYEVIEFDHNLEAYILIDWCLIPTLAVFQLYRGIEANQTSNLTSKRFLTFEFLFRLMFCLLYHYLHYIASYVNISIYTNQRLSRACIAHLVIKRTNWSYVKSMSCSGSHLGISINIKKHKVCKGPSND